MSSCPLSDSTSSVQDVVGKSNDRLLISNDYLLISLSSCKGFISGLVTSCILFNHSSWCWLKHIILQFPLKNQLRLYPFILTYCTRSYYIVYYNMDVGQVLQSRFCIHSNQYTNGLNIEISWVSSAFYVCFFCLSFSSFVKRFSFSFH